MVNDVKLHPQGDEVAQAALEPARIPITALLVSRIVRCPSQVIRNVRLTNNFGYPPKQRHFYGETAPSHAEHKN